MASIDQIGLYEYTRVSFGLKKAPTALQRAMDIVPPTVKWNYAFFYRDDNIIFSRTLEQHTQQNENVLKVLSNRKMTLTWKKCSFFVKLMSHWSHIIAPGKVHVAAETTEASKALQHSNTPLEQQSFLDGVAFTNVSSQILRS